jgi:hypothetical protein
MVIIKERYAQCNEAKTQLTQDLVSLQQEYSSLISSSSIVSNIMIENFVINKVTFSSTSPYKFRRVLYVYSLEKWIGTLSQALYTFPLNGVVCLT